MKAILIQEAGVACAICGYARHQGALQFHHVDPSQKSFMISTAVGVSLERFRAEASKCVLLCANCHFEVEGGVTPLPGSRCPP